MGKIKDKIKKRRLLRKRKHDDTHDYETDMSQITVTPDGNYVEEGNFGNNEDMIPEGAETGEPLSVITARQNAEAAQRGARYFNNAMERGSAPFRTTAIGLLSALNPEVAGITLGATGLYNTFSGNNGLIENADRVFNDPKSTNLDLTKAIMPAMFQTALDASMVSSAPRTLVGTAAKLGSKDAAAALVSNAIRVNTDRALDAARKSEDVLGIYRPLYEKSTSVVKSEPYAKVWRNGQGWNSATSYKLDTKPSYFEVVSDREPGNYSIHFKTGDPAYGIDGRKMVNQDEKRMLFDAVRYDFPRGGRLSTWGEVSPGGVHGLNRFNSDYGWQQVGQRTTQLNGSGEEISIPVLQKPVKPKVPFIREADTYVKHPNDYLERHRYAPEIDLESSALEPAAQDGNSYFLYNSDTPRIVSQDGLQIGYLYPTDFSQAPYSSRNYIREVVKKRFDPRGDLQSQHEQLAEFADAVHDTNPASLRLYDQYSNAMGRRRSYRNQGLMFDFDDGNRFGVKYGNGAVLGHNKIVVDPNTGKEASVFVASHFAPESLRQGLSMIDGLGRSGVPTVFAVTPDLSPMLYKTGQFARLTQTMQPFNGQLVLKDVMINRSVKPWMAESLIGRNMRIGENEREKLADMFGQLQFKPAYPHRSFTLKDMLSDDDIQKLNDIK